MLSIRNERLSKILITPDPARLRGWVNVRCVVVGTVAECILQCIYERFTAAGRICVYQPTYNIMQMISDYKKT